MKQSDAIVIGSGVAGLSFAIKLAVLRPDLKVCLFTKETIIDSNSNYAQGGIASVVDFEHDSFKAHIADTLKSGCGLSDPKIVDFVVCSGPERIRELSAYGANFNKTNNTDFDLALEGGHSSPRVVHSFDHTGSEIIRSLVAKMKELPNIEIHEHFYCFELIKTDNNRIGGVRLMDTLHKKTVDYSASIVVLATGGSGQVFRYTTNPVVATGDGLALGIKAGAKVSNLNYFQFHPTAFVEENQRQLFLISEAVRGFGAHVLNDKGVRFLFNYDKRGELATRDVVSKAIFNELKNSAEDFVFMDCRHLDENIFEDKFPMIHAYLSAHGIDPMNQLIPIAPAAHYQCGGLKVDEFARTQIDGLFAIGEVAETGLHGANRLASNSLLEALVFAHEAAVYVSENSIANTLETTVPLTIIHVNEEKDSLYLAGIQRIKKVMSRNVTITSSLRNIHSAKRVLGNIQREMLQIDKVTEISTHKLIFKNLLLVAQEIVKASISNYKKDGVIIQNHDQIHTKESKAKNTLLKMNF